jgi:hypothetical protein
MRWVTREHVHVERVACPWLIERFIDPQAEFLFVAPDQVMAVAQREGAIPFDARGQAELDHHEGKCFEAIVAAYDLTEPALLKMAELVHAADIRADRDLVPEAAGLEAVAVGYSRLFPDDHENLAHQFEVYDALYAWCQARVGGNG